MSHLFCSCSFFFCFFLYPPHCVLLKWVSWGTFCLSVVILGLSLILCVWYLRVTGWRFCNFPLWLEILFVQFGTRLGEREQGWQAASWDLRALSFLLRSVCCAGRLDKGSGVWACQEPWICRADEQRRSRLVWYSEDSYIICYLSVTHVFVTTNDPQRTC